MKTYALALDLKDDPQLIREYEEQHQKVWPEIIASIKYSGINRMEIYRLHTRLFMIMETDDDFSWEAKVKSDKSNPMIQQWEELMWRYQQALPMAKPGEKWMLMDKIFEL